MNEQQQFLENLKKLPVKEQLELVDQLNKKHLEKEVNTFWDALFNIWGWEVNEQRTGDRPHE